MERETVLITGAAGFIGGQLAYKLYKLGYDLILVDNMSYGHEDNLQFDDVDLNEILYVMDIRSKEFEQLFEEKKIDYVYNIAGIAPLPDCQCNPAEAVDVNFGKKFWEYVKQAGYEHCNKSSGVPQFYRFSHPISN